MPAYNYGGGTPRLTYGGASPYLSNRAWQVYTGRHMNPLAELTYNYLQPEVGYEAYMQYLNPTSLTQEKALRIAQPNIYNEYQAWVNEDWINRTDTKWTDWLANEFDPNMEIARLSPNARYERPDRFGNSARWVSFG